MNLRGAAEMIEKIRKVASVYPKRVEAALYQEAQILMTEAKRRCPVASDGGTLRASGRVSEPARHGRRISVTMSFGGAADAYAIAVHETPSEHDPPSWQAMYGAGGQIHWTSAGTGPKFLEGPINEARGDMAARLAARLQLKDEA